MLKYKKQLIISCILIFIFALISIKAYSTLNTPHELGIPTDKIEKATLCLKHAFATCAAGDEVRQLLSYRLISTDKALLMALSIILASFITSIFGNKNNKTELIKKTLKLGSLFFLFFSAAQYSSLTTKTYIWEYLQHSWQAQGMDITRNNCINGISASDCNLVNQWLQLSNLKAKALQTSHLLALACTSIAVGFSSIKISQKT